MNIRGAAGGGGSGGGGGDGDVSLNADISDLVSLMNVGRKMLAMDELWPGGFNRIGPSPVAHNGRYWTPDRRRENAETVRYIRCLVQTCEAIKPRETRNLGQASSQRSKVTMDQLPRIMQKVRYCNIRRLLSLRIKGIFLFEVLGSPTALYYWP